MTTFQYKAVTAEGEVFEGSMEAASPAAVGRKLQELGHIPIRAVEHVRTPRLSAFNRDLFADRPVSRKALCFIPRELATLLDAGLPLERALEILLDLTTKENARRLLSYILRDLRAGAALSQALEARRSVFPRFYISLVRAGEIGGTLEASLARLADHLEKTQALVEEIRSALIYPLLLLIMTGLSLVVLLTLVVPEFKPLFEDAGDALPLATQIVLAASDLLASFWWLGVLATLAFVGLLRWLSSRPVVRHRWHALVLRIPIFGELEREIEVARLSRSLGTLLQNGVTLLTGLTVVRQSMSNLAMAQALEEVISQLKAGRRLADLLASSNVIPSLAVQLVRVGEETGRLEAMLIKVADIYDGQVRITIRRLLDLLVPALTVGLGALIAAVIASVLVALLSVNELAV